MKVVARLVILGLVVVGGFNYLSYQKTGVIPAQAWVENAQKAFTKLHAQNATSDEARTVKISKWTDTKGVVHYENRPVEGAKTLEVDPDKNVLPPTPIVELPESDVSKSKPKTMDEEMQELRDAKHAKMEAIINR